ncbi:MAG: oligosaccharide flippase family protein [Bacteroidetes bacterium]|nr:oligosaccharide flippase family protein [Bacteroidota bacterium]
MKRQKFFADVLFVQGLNISVKAAWILLIDRAVQNSLPERDYGSYFGVLSFTILFIILLDLGFNNLNSRSVAKDINYYRENFVGYIVTKLITTVLFLTALMIGAWFLGYSENQIQLLIPLAAFQIISSFNAYFRSNLSASHRFKMDAVLAVIDRLIVVIVVGTWLTVDSMRHYLNIWNFAMIQVIGSLATLFVSLTLNRIVLGPVQWKVHFPGLKNLFRKSAPYAILAALMALYTRVDAVMIQYMKGDEAADVYAMGYRLLDAGSMVAALLSGMLLPMFSRESENATVTRKLIGISARILIVPATIFALLIAAHPGEILTLMYPDKVNSIAPVTFTFLMFSFVSSCTIFIVGTFLTALGKMRYLNILAMISVGLNVLLNAILIPSMSTDGAALATLITQSFFALGCVNGWRKEVGQSFGFSDVKTALAALSAFALIYFLSGQFFKNTLVHIAFGLAVALLVVVASGLINIRMLKQMSSRKTQEPSDF